MAEGATDGLPEPEPAQEVVFKKPARKANMRKRERPAAAEEEEQQEQPATAASRCVPAVPLAALVTQPQRKPSREAAHAAPPARAAPRLR